MTEQRFPKGWDAKRVQDLISELDSRTDEEWIAAAETALTSIGSRTLQRAPARTHG